MSWKWVKFEVVMAVHDIVMSMDGCSDDFVDVRLIEAALAWPKRMWDTADPDMAAMAATYGLRLAQCRGFAAGNERVAWIVMRIFLADHGYKLACEDLQAIYMMRDVAAGSISELGFGRWIRDRMRDA